MNPSRAAAVCPGIASPAQEPRRPFAGLDRLQVLRFPLIVGVVFFHNHPAGIELADGSRLGHELWDSASLLVRDLLSHALGGVRVPLFFLIAGYLFALGLKAEGRNGLLAHRLGRRMRSIGVPLALWNLGWLALLVVLRQIEPISMMFSGKTRWSVDVDGLGPLGVLDAVLGLTGLPLVYPLWFLRDLLVMSLLSVPLLLVAPVARWIVAAAALAAWCLVPWAQGFPTPEAVAFHTLGVVLALQGRDLVVSPAWGRAAVALFLLLLALRLAIPAGAEAVPAALSPLYGLSGMLAVLYASKWIVAAPKLRAWLIGLAPASFFVLLAHEPLLTAMRKLAYLALQPDSASDVLGLYLALPLLAITLLVGLHRWGSRRWPRTMALLTGGRLRQAGASTRA